MDIIYREAKCEDAGALLEHISKVGGETDNLSFGAGAFNISAEREAKFIERFAKNKNDIMLVALEGGRVVGNAALESERIPRYSHRATLSVTVLREFWGRGIGSRLLEMLIDFARDSQIEVISLEVRSDNERAISLYKKFGFILIGRYKKFFKIGDSFYDADLMQLLI